MVDRDERRPLAGQPELVRIRDEAVARGHRRDRMIMTICDVVRRRTGGEAARALDPREHRLAAIGLHAEVRRPDAARKLLEPHGAALIVHDLGPLLAGGARWRRAPRVGRAGIRGRQRGRAAARRRHEDEPSGDRGARREYRDRCGLRIVADRSRIRKTSAGGRAKQCCGNNSYCKMCRRSFHGGEPPLGYRLSAVCELETNRSADSCGTDSVCFRRHSQGRRRRRRADCLTAVAPAPPGAP